MPSTTATSTRPAHVCIEVLASDREAAEILSAEAFEAGVSGIEEREANSGIRLLLYLPAALESAVRAVVSREVWGARVGATQTIDAADWSEQWKLGLRAAEISPRLLVRPSFVESRARSGQRELIVDPAQAFGTGGHPSTHLALEWVDECAQRFVGREGGWRVLDVGTGTGVLSLAALALGAARAVAFDLDPLAAEATRQNAGINRVAQGLDVFVGPIDALADVGFDLVVANLLRTELLPLIAGIARRVRADGVAVFSGLLQTETAAVADAALAAGLSLRGTREMADANGDLWSALLMGA